MFLFVVILDHSIQHMIWLNAMVLSWESCGWSPKNGWWIFGSFFSRGVPSRHISNVTQFSSTRWMSKNPWLGGGFKDCLFSSLLGEDSHFDWYFSKGLKPPTKWPTALENSEVVSTKTVRWCFSVRNLWDSPPSSQCHTRVAEILPDGRILISTCTSKKTYIHENKDDNIGKIHGKSPFFNRKYIYSYIYLFILLVGFSSHSLFFSADVEEIPGLAAWLGGHCKVSKEKKFWKGTSHRGAWRSVCWSGICWKSETWKSTGDFWKIFFEAEFFSHWGNDPIWLAHEFAWVETTNLLFFELGECVVERSSFMRKCATDDPFFYYVTSKWATRWGWAPTSCCLKNGSLWNRKKKAYWKKQWCKCSCLNAWYIGDSCLRDLHLLK